MAGNSKGAGYDGEMGALPWIGLAVFVVAVVAGVVVAAVRGLAAYRGMRSFQRRLNVAVVETQRLLDGIEPRLAKATATAARLDEARAQLERSLATLRVLTDAFGEALALVRRVTAFVPR
jgi:negative regulator of sigma E activity